MKRLATIPKCGSIFYNLSGPEQGRANAHMTVAVPGATTQSTGLPDNNKLGGAWIMNAGDDCAHHGPGTLDVVNSRRRRCGSSARSTSRRTQSRWSR